MSVLIKNIKHLLQVRERPPAILAGKDMASLPSLNDAWLWAKDGLIHKFGLMAALPTDKELAGAKVIDASGKIVLPTWCDSHTHLVYAGSREAEFADRINGLTYEEIATRGGGILNSAAKLNQTSEEELLASAYERLKEVVSLGTGAIEIKSGYGLSLAGELKMLRVIQQLKRLSPIPIKATFLGAHAFPKEFASNHRAYIDLIINEMLPHIGEEKLADYIDVFCETNYFSVSETEEILEAGARYGLKAKVHVNQFTAIGGVAACLRHQAVSVDHLEIIDEADIVALQSGSTIPVALPSCSFFIGIPYTPARQIIEAGLPIALATDYNPGSTPSGSMPFVISLACIKMKMTPREAINAATLNAAAAMELQNSHGSITVGKAANLIITKAVPSVEFLPYAFGSKLIDQVLINGKSLPESW